MPADLVEPAFLSLPDYDRTLGPEVGAVATLAGFAPDPEQQMLLDAAFAIDGAGKSVAFEVVVIAPRQNLKTGFLKQVALGQMFVRDERLVVWSAHEFATAQEALRDMEALIDGSDVLRRRVKMTNRGDVAKHGAVPEIELLSGARLVFKTRTAGGGRGLSGRKVFLDEGFALQAGQVGALMPIMLAQPDPQVFIGSSACRPESEVLWEIVQRGRSGGGPRMVYAEWCAPPPEVACDRADKCDHGKHTAGCGCDKPEMVQKAHSAVARGRILLETVLDLRESMPADEFGREVMGWHDAPDVNLIAIDPQQWLETVDPASVAAEVAAFGIAVSLDRSAAVGVAGIREDGTAHLEVVRHDRGTGWVVDYCVALAEESIGATFVVDGGGPASSLIDALENAGLTVETITTRDLGSACAWLVDAVHDKRVFHGPQPELDEAVAGAMRRDIGDGMFAFGRRLSTVDIAPLEAVTLAAHVLPSVLPLDSVTAVFL